ncbi:hypothetical protein IDH07_01735 [Pelagibacterales bacterium SAG-MED04]|nr:hypothetical protein [Pelagibacterales bacterium SAG-MED04]
MRKFLLKFFIATTVLIFLPIIYLSTIGIETESFNEQIKNKVNESNKNLQLNLKKIEIKLDPLKLKFNAKTVGATVYYYNKPLELEYIGTEVSLASIIKNKFVSSNLEIGSKSLPLGDLIKFARTAYKGPELFILEKIIKKGHIIFDLKINYDENGKIKDDYEINGIIKDGKIQLLNNYSYEKINFIFNLKKQEFKFQEIKFATNKIDFFSNKVNVKQKEDIFYIDGNVKNKDAALSKNFLKIIKLNLKNLNFDNTTFSSDNSFSFEVNKNFKLKNMFLKSNIDLDQLKYNRESYISDFFSNINEEIVLKNHKLKLQYSNNLLSIIGEGEIKLEENFNKIDYIYKKNDQSFNIQSNLTIDAISLKKQDFISVFFPSANENINLKNQKINIKYNNKKLSLAGEGKIKVDDEFESIKYLISTKDKKINFDLDLNLDKTDFEVNFFNYKKNNKIDTQLKIDGYYEQDKNLSLNNLTILEDKNKIEVSNLVLNKNNSIINFDYIEFDYLDTESKLNKYSIKKIKKDDFDIIGFSLNANTLITNLLKGNDKKRNNIFQNNIALNIKLDEVFLDEVNYISDLKGNLFIKDNSVVDANLSALFGDKKNMTFSINSDAENNKITTLYSSKAKPLVDRYKFIKGFDEGYLDFYSSKKDNISTSKLNIYDFKLKELPVLTKILTLASLQGIADILSGEGIRFDEFEMNFKNQGDLMTIDEIYAIGPAISILMSGYVEDDKLISLRGTLVPATTINKTISSIPVLGKILVGDKTGEGVFGVSFKIKGPPKKLETTVNPIKTLTPRFITRTIEKIKKN